MSKFPKTLRAAVEIVVCGGLIGASVPASAGSNPFLGEIEYVGFNFAPVNWATCDGQIMSISQSTALFSLLGTMYGGNGTSTFALPDLRGRFPMHVSANHPQGEQAGAESVTLTFSQMPIHSHNANTTVDATGLTLRGNKTVTANTASPDGNALAVTGRNFTYANTAPDVDMKPGSVAGTATALTSVGPAGGSQPVNILPPYTVVNCIISLSGIFPSRP